MHEMLAGVRRQDLLLAAIAVHDRNLRAVAAQHLIRDPLPVPGNLGKPGAFAVKGELFGVPALDAELPDVARPPRVVDQFLFVRRHVYARCRFIGFP